MIKITYLRSSSLNQWYICQHSYYLSYVLGIEQAQNRKALLGTVTHKVLEVLAKSKRIHDNASENIYNDDICHEVDYRRVFISSYIDLLCEASFNHYFTKYPNVIFEKDIHDIVKWVHKTLEFNNGIFDPRKRQIIEEESPFNIEIPDRWAQYDYSENEVGNLRIKGTIDLITKVKDDIYEGIDWKTGRRVNWGTGKDKDMFCFMIDPQLRIYHMAMMNMYPHVKQFFPTIFYINDGGPWTVPLSNKDVEGTKLILKKTFEDIKACEVPKLKSPGCTHWWCQKVCKYGTTPYKNTEKCQCQFIKEKIQKIGLEQTTIEETVAGHSVSHYRNPGE